MYQPRIFWVLGFWVLDTALGFSFRVLGSFGFGCFGLWVSFGFGGFGVSIVLRFGFGVLVLVSFSDYCNEAIHPAS